MATPSGRTSTVTHPDNPEYPHVIPLDEDSICSEPPLPTTTGIQPIPTPTTEYTATEPIDETLHKKSVEPLYIHDINTVHNNATNLPPVPNSSTPPT